MEATAPSVSDPAADARHDAATAMKQALLWINGVMWLFRVGAIAYGVQTIVAIVALQDLRVPLGAGVIVVGLSAALTVIMLIGALRVHFEPFRWTIASACIATAVALVHLVGPNPLDLAFLWTGLWAAVLWATIVPMRHSQRLMAQHQDLYILHHASRQTRHALQGRTPQARHERLVAAMRKAGLKAWKVTAVTGGSILVAIVIAMVSFVAGVRPDEFAPSRVAFERAWNNSSLIGIEQVLAEEAREHRAAWLGGMAEGHGWGDRFPALGDGTIRDDKLRNLWIDYDLGDDVLLSVHWRLRDREWWITNLELPEPMFEPVLERFVAAWNDSSPEQIATFYSAENRARIIASIQRSVSNLNWRRYPTVLTTETEEHPRRRIVTLNLDEGEAITRWFFRDDGRWGLTDLDFPRQ